MSAYYLLYKKHVGQCWSENTKLDLCMEFIDAMEIDERFKEFLQDQADAENIGTLDSRFDPSTIPATHIAHGKSFDEEEIS